MSTIIKLEEEVMRCWEVTQDLALLAEVINNGSDHSETVKGIAKVYDLRFEKAWDTYEQLVKEHYELREEKKYGDME